MYCATKEVQPLDISIIICPEIVFNTRLGTGDDAGQDRKDKYALRVFLVDVWENGGHHLQSGVMVKLGLGDVMVVEVGLYVS